MEKGKNPVIKMSFVPDLFPYQHDDRGKEQGKKNQYQTNRMKVFVKVVLIKSQEIKKGKDKEKIDQIAYFQKKIRKLMFAMGQIRA